GHEGSGAMVLVPTVQGVDPEAVVVHDRVVERTDHDQVVDIGRTTQLPRDDVVGVQVAGVRAARELAPFSIPRGERPDLSIGGEAVGAAEVHAVAGPIVEQELDLRVAGEPLRGGGGEGGAVVEAGGAGGGIDVHDDLGLAALHHLPVLGAAGHQRHERVGAAGGDAVGDQAGFLFAGPLHQVRRLGCGVGGGRCAFRYLCLDRRDQLRPVLGGEAGAEF